MRIGRVMVVCSALLPLGCAGMMGGGQSWQLQPTSNAYAAQGSVKAKKTDDGNTALKIKVKHLAPPNKLVHEGSTFVVWARPSSGSGRLQNLGAIRLDKDREGKLEAITPLKEMQLVITPESQSHVQEPTGDPVLQGQVIQEP